MIKALSIQQPWAWAILHKGKDIENRGWQTPIRETILIHVPKTFDSDALPWLAKNGIIDPHVPLPEDIFYGSGQNGGLLVGMVTIVKCIPLPFDDSIWAMHSGYGFVLKDPHALDNPTRYAGKLGFFDVPFHLFGNKIIRD